MKRLFSDLPIRYKLLLSTCLTLIIVIGLSGFAIYRAAQKTMEAGIEAHLAASTEMLQNIVKTSADVSIKNYLRSSAEANKMIVENFYRQYRQGRITEEEAKRLSRNVLLSQTIGRTGYIYCTNKDGIAIVHPVAGVEGRSFTDHAFVREQMKLKEGYLTYEWKNPGETAMRPKALYMTYFKPWDWIISVSSYRSEFIHLVSVSDIRQSVLSMRFGQTGYSYIVDTQGNFIIHPEYQGNAKDLPDPDLRMVAERIMHQKVGKFVYNWQNPGEKTPREKIVILNYIPELDWIVAASGYTDEFYRPLHQLRNTIICFSLMALAVVFAITLGISFAITNPLKKLMGYFAAGAANDFSVRMPASSGDEAGQLARYFNMFMEKLQQSSDSLHAEILEHERVQEALRESEKQYRQLFMNAPAAIYEADYKTRRFLSFNDMIPTLTGYSKEDLVQMNPWDLFTEESQQTYLNRMQCMKDGVNIPTSQEYAIRKKDGGILWINMNIDYTLESGQPVKARVVAHDITDRKHAEEALKESERKYRLLTEKMADIVWIADMNLRVQYVTPSIQKVLGFTQEERMNQTVEQQFTPESVSYGMEALARELALEEQGTGNPGRTVTLLLEHYHKDGSTRWMETVIGGLRDERGVLTGLHGLSRDVTERKKAEDALRQSEERYRRITENMFDLITEVTAQGIFTYLSPSHPKIVGYAPEELLGKPVYENIHPDDLERSLVEFRKGAETGLAREVEYRYRHKDGYYIWVRSIGYALSNSAGENTGWIFSSREITERKRVEEALYQSEERYRTLLDEMEEGYYEVDLAGNYRFVNEQYLRLLGYTKEDILGRNFALFVAEKETAREIRAAFNQLYKTGRPLRNFQYDIVRKDGSRRTLELFASLLKDSNQQPVGFRGIFRDITDRKHEEEEREKLKEQLTQAQKMESVGRLAGGVAHDFNNMLSVIIGNTEMAINRVDRSDPLKKSLQSILNAGKRSADLTRQLLAFARKQTVSPRVLDLNDTVTGMLKMLQRLIGENIDLVWHPGHSLWEVKIDPSQVDQLLANLTVNARDAIEKTGTITIETSNTICDESFCTDQPEWVPGDYVVLAVSDDGCGMDKETLSNIFEPFFTTKKEGQGTGLGLATVYGIVKQNRGYVNVYSEPGRGTTFRIYLPRCRGNSSEARDDRPDDEVPGGTETILIVEDEASVLDLGRAMLAMLGYTVLTASSTDQALKRVHEYNGKIDLLLTDVVMPGMNGRELAENLRAVRPDLKCLYMSGYTADLIARQGILDEGVQFISKPFFLKDLAGKVRETLGS